MLSGPVNSVTMAARTTPLLVSFTGQTKVVRNVASPVPSPSYVVPGGATDGQVVNLVDDAPTTVYEIAGIVGATYYRPRTLFPNPWMWRHCSNPAPTMASPNPRPPSNG
jgi:hypothetical protein